MEKSIGAVIGLGYWGPNLVRNFTKIPSVEIKRVCDISKKNIQQFKHAFPHIQATDNYADILNDSSIDFVAIATPLHTHYSLSKQALNANKHVLIEKPMTSTSKEAKDLIKTAKKNNVILFVGHTFVYSEAVRKIKEVIRKETFGKLLYFDSTRINLGRFHADTNVIWDLAPHDFSILHFLCDTFPIRIHVIGSSALSPKIIDIAHIYLTYADTSTAHIHVSWLSPVKIRNILIGGSKRMITYNDIEPSEKVRIYNSNITLPDDEITPFNPLYRSGNVLIPHITNIEALYTELHHFIDCIRNKKTPLTDGNAGLKVVQLLEAADQSIVTGKPVALNL